jgi:hypothetical protein
MMVWKVAGLYLCIAPILHVDRGLRDNFHTDPAGLEQTLDMQLLLSHDGVGWQRLFNRQPFLELGPPHGSSSTPRSAGGVYWPS